MYQEMLELLYDLKQEQILIEFDEFIQKYCERYGQDEISSNLYETAKQAYQFYEIENNFYLYYDYLIDNGICNEDEVNIVTSIFGSSIENLNNILYYKTAFNSIIDYELSKF